MLKQFSHILVLMLSLIYIGQSSAFAVSNCLMEHPDSSSLVIDKEQDAPMDHSMHNMQSSKDSEQKDGSCCNFDSECQMTNCAPSVLNPQAKLNLAKNLVKQDYAAYLASHANTPPNSLYRPPIWV